MQVYWDASAIAPVKILGVIPSGQPFELQPPDPQATSLGASGQVIDKARPMTDGCDSVEYQHRRWHVIHSGRIRQWSSRARRIERPAHRWRLGQQRLHGQLIPELDACCCRDGHANGWRSDQNGHCYRHGAARSRILRVGQEEYCTYAAGD